MRLNSGRKTNPDSPVNPGNGKNSENCGMPYAVEASRAFRRVLARRSVFPSVRWRLTFIIEGGGILYKMCLGIVGTRVRIRAGRFPLESVREMLALRDRRVSGMNALAHGLVLRKVIYPKAGR
jgi:tRNA U38,U39,U40 pseudouridine synthase TruA